MEMDNLDTMIIDRLGEHNRKLEFVRNRLKNKSRTTSPYRKVTYTLLSIAACVAIICVTWPSLFRSNQLYDMSLPEPSFASYRGDAASSIETYMDAKEYARVLTIVDDEILELQDEISDIDLGDVNLDEKEYIYALYNEKLEELMWCKIYLLIKLQKNYEVKLACGNYLGNNTFDKYRNTVKKILKKI